MNQYQSSFIVGMLKEHAQILFLYCNYKNIRDQQALDYKFFMPDNLMSENQTYLLQLMNKAVLVLGQSNQMLSSFSQKINLYCSSKKPHQTEISAIELVVDVHSRSSSNQARFHTAMCTIQQYKTLPCEGQINSKRKAQGFIPFEHEALNKQKIGCLQYPQQPQYSQYPQAQTPTKKSFEELSNINNIFKDRIPLYSQKPPKHNPQQKETLTDQQDHQAMR